MATDIGTVVTIEGTGLYLIGEFLGFRDQRSRTVYEGTERERTYQGCDVGIRTATGPESVGYSDRDSAERAWAGTSVGTAIAVSVTIRHGVNANGPWMLYSATADTGGGGFSV